MKILSPYDIVESGRATSGLQPQISRAPPAWSRGRVEPAQLDFFVTDLYEHLENRLNMDPSEPAWFFSKIELIHSTRFLGV